MPLRDDMITILNKLIGEQGPTHGSALLTDDRLLRNLLADYAPQFIAERNLILLAVREKMAEALFKAAKHGEQVDPILVGRLIRQLENDHSIAPESAQWAIRAWVEGLDRLVPPQFRNAPPPAPTPPPVPVVQAPLPPAPTRPIIQVAPTPPQPPIPQYRLGDRWIEPKSGLKMVYVPPGEFLMGSDKKDSDERPVHKVHITQGFWLGLTPITNAMYVKFVNAGGYRAQTYWTNAGWKWKGNQAGPENYNHFTTPDQPRVGVTWYEAVAFCSWAGLRLPTEAEWEYAARGPENRVYPWGNDFDANRVIYSGNSGRRTHPVGEGIRAAGASWCGALDMSGNVWEWVSSKYEGDYPYRADDGREDLAGDANRRVRGGSWGDNQDYARAAFRLSYDPRFRFNFFGFRVVVGGRPPSV